METCRSNAYAYGHDNEYAHCYAYFNTYFNKDAQCNTYADGHNHEDVVSDTNTN